MTDCPRCGAAANPGQEYCLECGQRLPGERFEPGKAPGRGWLARTAVALLVAVGGAAVAIAAVDEGPERAALTTATGGFASVPETTTLPAPGDASSPAIEEWPAGSDGWTVVLASIPQTEGRQPALNRAKQARRKGLTGVGILDSSQYASLHPGYWVVFSGVYSSEAEATSELEPARRISKTAAVRRVVP